MFTAKNYLRLFFILLFLLGTMQDSKVLELYMRSLEMFDDIDGEFNLSSYYQQLLSF